MRLGRVAGGIGLGALCAAGLFVAPALQAQENRSFAAVKREPLRGLGSFTPTAADPKLAAVLSRSGLPQASYRFTPSDSRRAGSNRSLMVAVRASSTRSAVVDRGTAPTVSVAPISYNLGVSVGWKRFAMSDVTKIDLVAQPGSRERADLGLGYSGKKTASRVEAVAERPLLTNAPALIGDKPSYSIDVGGSYSLSRNLDVTAGLRYKSDRERIDPNLTDNRRDSQAVYVGTAFRF